MPATAGCPPGSRSERNADRRARSDNARPIKVRTPAPGFSTDSDAREEAGFKNGQPAPVSRAPASSGICQQHPQAAATSTPAPRRTGPDFRARATPPPGTYGFSELRITVQDQPGTSGRLLSDLRCTPMDVGVRGCIRLGMRLFGRRGSRVESWICRARAMAAANCLCLPGPAEPAEWVWRGSGQFHALTGGLAADGVGRAAGVTNLHGR